MAVEDPLEKGGPMPYLRPSTTSGTNSSSKPRLSKFLKSLALVIAACLLLSALAACNGGGENPPDNNPGNSNNPGSTNPTSLNGTYEQNILNGSTRQITTYVFTSDGKVTYKQVNGNTGDVMDSKTGTYVINGSKMTLTLNGQSETVALSVKDTYILIKGLQYDKK